MDAQKIKEYLKQVFDLEITIHTHRQAISAYTKRRQDELPDKPQLIMPSEPNMPTLHTYVKDGNRVAMNELKGNQSSALGLLLAAAVVCSWFAVICWFGFLVGESDAQGVWALGLIISIVAIAICFSIRSRRWQEYTDLARQEDELNLQTHAQQMQQFSEAKKSYESEKQVKVAQYELVLSAYNNETTLHLRKLNELLISLEACLEKLYSQNIVYSKYRSLISIATLYEYFESGRCSELEGSNGAYNLYESELRANIIIGSLSQIISDIEQVKNGQYALYQELCRSNKVLESIADNTQLTAYYANVAAVAASADRYIIGIK